MDDSRLKALRAEMAKKKIDMYMLKMSDFHASEYVGDYFMEIEYLSGFTVSTNPIHSRWAEAGLVCPSSARLLKCRTVQFQLRVPRVWARSSR